MEKENTALLDQYVLACSLLYSISHKHLSYELKYSATDPSVPLCRKRWSFKCFSYVRELNNFKTDSDAILKKHIKSRLVSYPIYQLRTH